MKRLLLAFILAALCVTASAQVRITGTGIQTSGSGIVVNAYQTIPAYYFGLQFNSCTIGTTCPAPGSSCVVGTAFCYGLIRYWDISNAVTVPFVFPTNSTPTWTAFDPWMAFSKSNGLKTVLSLSRTPDWASQRGSRCIANGNPDATCTGPADFGCAYSGTAPTPPAGECWPNADIDATLGTGSDATFKNFSSVIATHLNGLNPATYINTAIWEPWNEANIGGMWGSGFTAPLITMTNDAYTQIVAANSRNVVTSPNSVVFIGPSIIGVAQYQGVYFGDPTLTSNVSMISIHSYMAMNGSTGQFTCIPGPSPTCNQGVAPPEEIVNLVAQVHRSVPTWVNYQLLDSEASWGFNNTTFCDADMRKAYVARLYLIGWAQGIYSVDWYHYDDSHNCSTALATPSSGGDAACISFGGPAVPGVTGWVECPAGVAFQQTYSRMVGNVMDQLCNGPFPPDSLAGTNWGVWTCHFANANGTVSLAAWRTDPAYTCSGGVCPTVGFTTTGPYTKFYTIDNGTPTTIGGGCASGCTVQIGAKPIFLSN